MGIFDALNTAVTGLQSQSFALQNISGNIANSQTTAYKGNTTQFEDLLSSQLTRSVETSGSVLAMSGSTITAQGDIQTSTVSTNMAINGDGFFVVQKPSGFTGGTPTFDGTNLYTRRGDFSVQNGYLVNGAGYYLMGVPIDPSTGNPVGNLPQLLQFQNNFLPAHSTTTLDYAVNLPAIPTTPGSTTTDPTSDLLNPANFISNPLVVNAQAATMTGSGAALTPDAGATVTGTVDTTGNTLAAAGTIVVNGTSISLTAGMTATQIASAVQSSGANVNASVDATTGFVTLTSASGTGLDPAAIPVDIGSGTSANVLSFLGVSAANTNPTNLLTQSAVAQGETMIVQFGGKTPTTITFGTASGQVQTLAQLNTQLSSLNGGTATLDQTTGNLTLAATSFTDGITVSGTVNPTEFGLRTSSALPPSQTVIGSDSNAFLNASVGGGAITAYNQAGSPVNLQFRWAKTDSSSLGAGHTDTWNLFYETNASATGTQPAWQNVGTNFTFDASGALTPPIASTTINGVSVNGVSLGNISLNFGSSGLTQFSDSNGAVNVNLLQQNGFAAGALQTISVSDKGRVTGAYSNGQTIDLASISLASFSGESFLQSVSGGAYAQTDTSGAAVLDASGQIAPSSLEGSNVDIADEFTKLIVTQQAYSANARVVTTSNQMLQAILNIIQ